MFIPLQTALISSDAVATCQACFYAVQQYKVLLHRALGG